MYDTIPPVSRGELCELSGSRRSYITKYRKSIKSSKNSVLSQIVSKKEENDMEDQQYISVKEFAQRAGISQQSVYQRLNKKNNKLCKYMKVVNGKKIIDIQALQDLYSIGLNNEIEQPDNDKELKQVVKQVEQDRTQELIDELRLKLREKDDLIQWLREEHEADRKKIDELDRRLSILLDQEQKLRAMALTDQKQETAEDQNTVEPMQSEDKEQEYNLFEPEQTSIWERIRQFFK